MRHFLYGLGSVAALGLGSATVAQTDYEPAQLDVKGRFSQITLEAMAQPFVGLTANGVVEAGLFPLRSTGVSTQATLIAAQNFVSSLRTEQKVRTIYSINSPEWRRWSNVDVGIFARQGLSLKEMSDGQRVAALELLREALSARGLQLSFDIMKTDQALREINQDELSFDEELYYLKLFGLPSSDTPWGWQLNGHHLAINYFVLGDQVVMTPTFLGGEPVTISQGKYAGTQILQTEQNLGLELMRSLSPLQQRAALLKHRKDRSNNQAEANRDNLVLEYAGAMVSEFTKEQRTQLLELLETYIGNLPKGHAAIRMNEIKSHLDRTRFAWVGEVAEDAVFYYRIHSPVLLIEFDHQMPVGTRKLNPSREPIRDHIHIVIRTPNGNDYGKDLLGQHLRAHSH